MKSAALVALVAAQPPFVFAPFFFQKDGLKGQSSPSVEPPRISVKTSTSADLSLLTVQASMPLQAEIRQEESRLILSLGATGVSAAIEDRSFHDDRVRMVRLDQTAGGDQLVVELASKALRPRVTHLASQNIYLIEIGNPSTEALGESPSPEVKSFDPHRWHHITIDPGHGGEDHGIPLPDGVFEKDLTLAIARRVRWAMQTKLGVETVLSRVDDRPLSLEDRVVAANKAQSNLFISIHLGNSNASDSSRSYVYLAKFAMHGEFEAEPKVDRKLLFVPWQQVQLQNLEGSQRLAECLQTEINRSLNAAEATLSYRRAPLKILASLNMPAVIVELGNIQQEAFRAQISTPQFQNLVAATFANAVEKFRTLQRGQ